MATEPTTATRPSLTPQRTRIIDLEQQAAQRWDTKERAGDVIEQLLDKWLCTSITCQNHPGGYCFIAYNGKHYKLSVLRREQWATAIVNVREGVTLLNLSRPLSIPRR